jgi:predicted PurR-regulated permease PerM
MRNKKGSPGLVFFMGLVIVIALIVFSLWLFVWKGGDTANSVFDALNNTQERLTKASAELYANQDTKKSNSIINNYNHIENNLFPERFIL